MDSSDVLDSLRNIERSLQALVRLQFAQVSKAAFADEVERKAFDLTGSKSTNQICKELRISPNRLTDLRSKWIEQGLLVKVGNSFHKTVE
jgi:hypothetical protein